MQFLIARFVEFVDYIGGSRRNGSNKICKERSCKLEPQKISFQPHSNNWVVRYEAISLYYY